LFLTEQKGGIENINGLIGKYFPERSNIDNISGRKIHEIQGILNNCPRKKT